MSYTILKLHKSKSGGPAVPTAADVTNIRLILLRSSLTEHLLKLSMEELVEFLQVSLSKNFYYEDDFVIEQLQAAMTELRRAKLDLPAPGTDARRQNHERPSFLSPYVNKLDELPEELLLVLRALS